jgi:predicted nucleotidyltransferase
MSAVRDLAYELGAAERTVRRAVDLGAIRSRRLSERRLRLADGELEYLRGHWRLLADLREALRTEPRVRVAILVGSMARGDDHARSDIDLIVDLRGEEPLGHMRLAMRVEEKLGREVDVARWDRVLAEPLSLLQVLGEGRPIVDRDDAWRGLDSRRPAIRKRAARAGLRHHERVAALREKGLLH